MTTDFGSCPKCGTPLMAAGQAACAVCGQPFIQQQTWAPPPPPAPPAQQAQTGWAQPAQPPQPAWSAPPPAYQPPQPEWSPQPQAQQTDPTWSPQPPAGQPGAYPPPGQPQPDWSGGYPQPYPGYVGYGPPPASHKGLIAAMCAGVGVLLVFAIAFAILMVSSRSSYPGSLTYSPSTITCGSSYTLTIKLPSTVKGTDEVTVKFDGKISDTETVSDSFAKQSDGSWLYTGTSGEGAWDCNSSGDTIGKTTVGKHTETIEDSKGNILAQGTYTLQ